ncbi:hypothetical protein OQJ19_01690 [Fluoribacter gormanii]|uniref:hypothetical protein n=2 Tax=Fluoribacter gormanii TaxID=464 RepID=UPI0022430AB8|nr:hypothetical protein [Fluoribacter gormanii]MCW8469368.1 hypothetical protein [Fluoribacter gormanii]
MNRIKLIIIMTLINFSSYGAQFTCPQTITCNFVAGTCSDITNEIKLAVMASEPFEGEKTINLAEIMRNKTDIDGYYTMNGKKIDIKETPFIMYCKYSYGNYSSIFAMKFVKEFVGEGWSHLGWGNTTSKYSNINRVVSPYTCMANY